MTKKEQQLKFLTLYEPVHDRFERYCRARVYGRLEYQDLMNDTLLIAFQKMDTLKSEKAFLSFIIGISVRVLANHNRKKKEELVAVSSNDEINDFVDVNANTDHDAEVYLLYKAIDLLPVEQKDCILLFEITGFSIKEIMVIQKCSESVVKQRLRRARIKLKEVLNLEPTLSIKEGE